MEQVIRLLQEKNEYLEQFYSVNEHELINFAGGDFDHLESFYQVRDKILELVRCVDGLINEYNTEDMSPKVTAEHKSQVEFLLNEKDRLVKAILTQDLQIMEFIEREKSKIIRELSSTRQARKAVGAYALSERITHLEE
jgi:hypothetical protein